jgi:rhamnose transport system permease protein
MSDLQTSDPVEHAHTDLVAPSQLSRGRRAFQTVVRSREASIALVLLLVIAAATVKSPSFLFNDDNWRDLLLTPSILLLLAAGQCVVIITRNVDLSVGSILGLTAYLTGRWCCAGSWWARCSGWSTGSSSPSAGSRPW